MPSHNQLIQNALAKGVRAGTVLQDAIIKVRRARRRNEYEFELALGELFVLASDAFKQRNGYLDRARKAEAKVKNLEMKLKYYKERADA